MIYITSPTITLTCIPIYTNKGHIMNNYEFIRVKWYTIVSLLDLGPFYEAKKPLKNLWKEAEHLH